MNFEDQTVVVAGGAGFVGGHLVRELLAAGALVVVLDNFHTGPRNKFDAICSDKLKIIEHDICDPIDIKCDLIMNLACPASPVHYQSDPLRTWRASVFGAAQLVELAARNGARLVHTSTSEVYGDPLLHPQTEDYVGNTSFTGPRACYDEGKRAAETYLLDMFREKSVDVRIARLFNTYGPEMELNDGRVVSNFVVQALRGEPLTVYGSGRQTRSFCFVEDTVKALLLLASGRGLQGAIMNVGNPDERTVLEIANMVCQLTGRELPTVKMASAIDDPQRRCPDISRAKDQLGWVPMVPLKEGLQRTIEEFRARLKLC